jgi:hypothetical protein
MAFSVQRMTQVKNERSITIVFPVLNNYNIEIVVAKDVAKARNERDDVYGPYSGHFAALHSHNGLGNACIVFPKDDLGLVDVAHECFHGVRAMMEWAGIEDEEAAAYHLGYLTKQVYDFVCARSKRSRRR